MANNNPMSTLYVEINNLLDEICTFLSDKRNLSSAQNVRSKTDILIGKLKHESKVLAQMKDFLVEGESYVEMKSQSTPVNVYVEFENPKEEIYCDIAENATAEESIFPDSIHFKDACPFINRKYSDFKSFRKKGVLSKREKMLFFDTNRKYYGVIYENYFLLYLSETDGQATHALNLNEFQGTIVDENLKSFFLINKTAKTPHIFFAVSEKDKFQWLAAINSKKAVQSTNELLKRPTGSNSIFSVNTDISLRLPSSVEPEEIYEILAEEEYEKVNSSQIDISGNHAKAYSKPLPMLPNLPSLPFRQKAIQPTPFTIRPTLSSDIDVINDNGEVNSSIVPSTDPDGDHYDIVCAPRIPKNHLAISIKPRSADIAAVHPSIVSALNRRFNMEVNNSPLMKKDCLSNVEPITSSTCSSDEYYDSILGPPRKSFDIEMDLSPLPDDIYDRVVNILPRPSANLKTQTMDELKARIQKIQYDKINANDIIKPADNDLQNAIIKAEVKIEKTKSNSMRYIFLRNHMLRK